MHLCQKAKKCFFFFFLLIFSFGPCPTPDRKSNEVNLLTDTLTHFDKRSAEEYSRSCNLSPLQHLCSTRGDRETPFTLRSGVHWVQDVHDIAEEVDLELQSSCELLIIQKFQIFLLKNLFQQNIQFTKIHIPK